MKHIRENMRIAQQPLEKYAMRIEIPSQLITYIIII